MVGANFSLLFTACFMAFAINTCFLERQIFNLGHNLLLATLQKSFLHSLKLDSVKHSSMTLNRGFFCVMTFLLLQSKVHSFTKVWNFYSRSVVKGHVIGGFCKDHD